MVLIKEDDILCTKEKVDNYFFQNNSDLSIQYDTTLKKRYLSNRQQFFTPHVNMSIDCDILDDIQYFQFPLLDQ